MVVEAIWRCFSLKHMPRVRLRLRLNQRVRFKRGYGTGGDEADVVA